MIFNMPGVKSSTQPIVSASFSFGCIIFMAPAMRNARANNPWIIQITVSMFRSDLFAVLGQP